MGIIDSCSFFFFFYSRKIEKFRGGNRRLETFSDFIENFFPGIREGRNVPPPVSRWIDTHRIN